MAASSQLAQTCLRLAGHIRPTAPRYMLIPITRSFTRRTAHISPQTTSQARKPKLKPRSFDEEVVIWKDNGPIIPLEVRETILDAMGPKARARLATEYPEAEMYQDVANIDVEFKQEEAEEGYDRVLAKRAELPIPDKNSLFFDEDDPDMEETPDELDMSEIAHVQLEELQEERHYARLIAWELPLLSEFARPFEPPAEDQVLRFRYTTYLGEHHLGQRKVVVEFSPEDVGLTAAQSLKLKKLVGPRYNPEKDTIKISCESHEHVAQNKRYLCNLIDNLIEAAKDATDMMEDIPLDLRHHKVKIRHRFPAEWVLTEERDQQLQTYRESNDQLMRTRIASGLAKNPLRAALEAQSATVELIDQMRDLLKSPMYKQLVDPGKLKLKMKRSRM